MRLQESGEMYLETILLLSRKSDSVRSIDVCESMGFSKPSVSRAMGLLKNAGYIAVSKNGFITLSETGKEVAEKIYARHTLLTDLLLRAGVSEAVAAEDACKIEHCISDETFDALSRLAKNVK